MAIIIGHIVDMGVHLSHTFDMGVDLSHVFVRHGANSGALSPLSGFHHIPSRN